jgi:transcriptional regulatory protein RtcR
MATLSAGGRITVEIVEDEVARLSKSWSMVRESPSSADLDSLCDGEVLSQLDPFDRVQLTEVVRVCLTSRSLSEAGRTLFAVSRTKKGTANDADRLRKYLARFGLNWGSLHVAGQ